MGKKSKRKPDELPILHPDAASIDIGANERLVAVPADRDDQSVRSFPTFTRDLLALADWPASLSDSFRCDGVDERVLDSRISDPGSAWV
jgi:hypothetical protein